MALLAVASICLLLARMDDAEETATPPHRPVAALPLPSPTAVQAAASARPTQLRAASASATEPVPAPPIGAEGYGPHIERAQVAGDAAQAWEAVNWLRGCAMNGWQRDNAEVTRNLGVAPEFMTQRMQELDADARRCQTVTARHQAMLGAPAEIAMHGGVTGAAAAYMGAVPPDTLAPQDRQIAADALRRDALAGHPTQMLHAVTSLAGWGIREDERLAFLYAYAALQGERQAGPSLQMMIDNHSIPLKAPPTPEQMETARRDGQLIVERVRAAGKP